MSKLQAACRVAVSAHVSGAENIYTEDPILFLTELWPQASFFSENGTAAEVNTEILHRKAEAG